MSGDTRNQGRRSDKGAPSRYTGRREELPVRGNQDLTAERLGERGEAEAARPCLEGAGREQREQGQREIAGMANLAEQAKLCPASVLALTVELVDLGAVSVGELSSEDWRGLRSWLSLRPFEQRRLLQVVDVERRV